MVAVTYTTAISTPVSNLACADVHTSRRRLISSRASSVLMRPFTWRIKDGMRPITRAFALLLLTAVPSSDLFAQRMPKDAMRTASLDRPSCQGDRLDAETYGTILSRQFSTLVSSATEGLPGSFLGVEIKEGQATAAQNFVFASGWALTVTARGAVNDGVVAILNDATLTPKFGASVQLHQLGGAKRSLQFTAASCDAMEAAVQKAELAYGVRMAEIDVGGDAIVRRLETSALAVKEKSIADALRAIPPGVLAQGDNLRRDSLRLEKSRVSARQAWLRTLPAPDAQSEEVAANNARGKAWREAQQLVEVRGVSLSWWSYGVSLDNASFNLFDPAATEQIAKETYLTRALTLTYSHLARRTVGASARYVAVNVHAGWENNLGELSKVELTDRTQFSAPPSERVSEQKTTAFQGTYRSNIETVRLNVDLYQFVDGDDRLAVHLFPAYSARQGEVGEVALGAGVLLSARDAAKKTSRANAELFFNVPDLPNAKRSDKGPWRRGVFGLRLTFPINFAPGS